MTKFTLIIIWKEDSIYFGIFICERNIFAMHSTVGHCCRMEREVCVVEVWGKYSSLCVLTNDLGVAAFTCTLSKIAVIETLHNIQYGQNLNFSTNI